MASKLKMSIQSANEVGPATARHITAAGTPPVQRLFSTTATPDAMVFNKRLSEALTLSSLLDMSDAQ